MIDNNNRFKNFSDISQIMVDNKYRKSSEIAEEITKCTEKRYLGCDLSSLLSSLVIARTRETVSERAPKALPILDELIERLEEGYYDPPAKDIIAIAKDKLIYELEKILNSRLFGIYGLRSIRARVLKKLKPYNQSFTRDSLKSIEKLEEDYSPQSRGIFATIKGELIYKLEKVLRSPLFKIYGLKSIRIKILKRLNKPYSRPFINNILLAIRDHADKYIQPGDYNYEYDVSKFIDGLKFLLKDNVPRDIYKTYISILKGKFENPYLSTEERYKRYYKYLQRDNFSYLSFEEQLSRIREQQAIDYIHMGIGALMRHPGLGILTEKNKLEYLLFGYY